MEYLALHIKYPPSAAELIPGLMNDAGCLGCLANEDEIIAYFMTQDGLAEACRLLTALSASLTAEEMTLPITFFSDALPDQDWNETWKKSFSPIEIGQNLTILPPWEKMNSGRTALIIDPGMAFGTGHHETTRFCLTTIERLSATTGKKSFLDVGTGTGVLAIAARKLGFSHAVGVDTDPLATDAARRNADLNELSDITFFDGGVEQSSGTYDLIAANLLSEILISISKDIVQRMEPEGVALLSGIMTGQEEDVIATFKALGLTLLETLHDGKWVSLIFKH